MPKILIAVKSCIVDMSRGCHDAIRETWGKDFLGNADVRFFVGCGIPQTSFHHDDIQLLIPDDYMSLPAKTKAICMWSVYHNYDFTYFCDTDTFLRPDRLLACGFENYDYTGMFRRALGVQFSYPDPYKGRQMYYPWASGGVGYFLSKKAAAFIRDAQITSWAEDLWVGQVLGAQYNNKEITILEPKPFNKHAAFHWCATGKNRRYEPEWMRKAYAQGEPSDADGVLNA